MRVCAYVARIIYPAEDYRFVVDRDVTYYRGWKTPDAARSAMPELTERHR